MFFTPLMGNMTIGSFSPASLHITNFIQPIIMALEQKDLELIERVIYKNGDDVAVSLSRSFERLEERLDAMESRLYHRLDDVEDVVVNKS